MGKYQFLSELPGEKLFDIRLSPKQ